MADTFQDELRYLCPLPERHQMRRHYLRTSALRLSGRYHRQFCSRTGSRSEYGPRYPSCSSRRPVPSRFHTRYRTWTGNQEIYLLFLRKPRSVTRIRRRTANSHGLLPKDRSRATASYRQAQPPAGYGQHRTAARLLHAFL